MTPTTHEEALRGPFADLPALVRLAAAERPGHPAVQDGTLTLGYADLVGLVDRIAATLADAGVGPGDAVALSAPTSAAYVASFLAVLQVGGVATPLAPGSSAATLAAMIADSGARLLLHDAGTAAALDAEGFAGPPRVRMEGLEDPAFQAWLAPEGRVGPRAPIDPEQPFNIIYSSGTTGTPKGIVQSHRMRWGHVLRGETLGYDARSVAIISTPLYSNTTLVSLVPALARGGTVVLMRKFDARGFLELAQAVRATHAMLVPVQYRRLMDLPEFDSFDLSSFRMKTCTSAPFAADLKADILRRWPGGLVEIFGMTEGGGTCLLFAHEHPDKLHTVGCPATGHDIRLIDEAGRTVPQGELGEVVGRSGAMMIGYHNQPEKTREAEWYDAEGRRFIRTGDVGRFDEDGFLVLMDRKKDMIISGGFNIYPSDLEAILAQRPEVAEAAVVGAPSRAWGETPVAFVTLARPGAIGAEELRAWVNGQVGKTQRLAAVVIRDVLPRSTIGKVLKRELRDEAAAAIREEAVGGA